MKITKTWAMPNSRTFRIQPIARLIRRHILGVSIDPFACDSKVAEHNNDIDPQYLTEYNMDALEFMRTWGINSVDTVLFDPPYSSRQVSEVYKKLDMTVNMQTTQSSFWGKIKKEVARVVKPGGKVITFGWNSGGVGKTLGFEQIEILLVAHGGWHNDTICTVERKL